MASYAPSQSPVLGLLRWKYLLEISLEMHDNLTMPTVDTLKAYETLTAAKMPDEQARLWYPLSRICKKPG